MKLTNIMLIAGLILWGIALLMLGLWHPFVTHLIAFAIVGVFCVTISLILVSHSENSQNIHRLELDLSAQQQIISKMYSKLYPRYHRRHR